MKSNGPNIEPYGIPGILVMFLTKDSQDYVIIFLSDFPKFIMNS